MVRDDGSSDGTAEMIDQYPQTRAALALPATVPHGPAAAAGSAIRHAPAPLVTMTDDTIPDPHPFAAVKGADLAARVREYGEIAWAPAAVVLRPPHPSRGGGFFTRCNAGRGSW